MTTSDTRVIFSGVSERLQQAESCGHRQLVLLCGPADPVRLLAPELLAALQLDHQAAWYGSAPPASSGISLSAIPARAWDTALGREFSAVVVDAHDGFDCDAMAALSGTVMAGGALVLLAPELTEWPLQGDPESLRISAWRKTPGTGESLYLSRFSRQLAAATRPFALSSRITARVLHEAPAPAASADRYAEQKALVKTLLQICVNGPDRVLLVTADRGRGKSAALGMLAARLVTEHNLTVLVCAHGKLAVEILYRHYQRSLPVGAKANLEFCPPDKLILLQGTADVLLVDEAANIPLPHLQQAAMGFNRTVFASTVQGYEGAGRGFAIRFIEWLASKRIAHSHLTLEQPVRWNTNDPLEAFTNQAFLLDAPLLTSATDLAGNDVESANLLSVTAHQLVENEPLLREIFALLVQAHYKTRPNDLRHILDANNLQCYALQLAGKCVAAALVAHEGPLHDLPLRQGILKKRRRPTGHLVPQLLAQYTGMATALDLKIVRIVRIAVHPGLQRRGLGSKFLGKLRQQFSQPAAENSNASDAMAAQFSASTGNLAFWLKNGFNPCHQGARRHSSGGHRSMLVVDALSKSATHCASLAQSLFFDTQRFALQFERLNQPFPGSPVSSEIATAEIATARHYDFFILSRYIAGERSFADSHAVVSRAVAAMLAEPAVLLDDRDKQILLAIQPPTCHLPSVARQVSMPGRKALESRLRVLLQQTTRTSP